MKNLKKVVAILLVAILTFATLSVGASAEARPLDVAFVIDTTGSMDDNIATVKSNMKSYLNHFENLGVDFRIAIVDYRDFASRTGDSGDYPYKVQLNFTSNYDNIIRAINGLHTGDGGDYRETICSALIDGVDSLSWRTDAKKSIILMGDAPALDPEPITGYTMAKAISKLRYGSFEYEEEFMEDAFSVIGEQASERGSIAVYAISTSGDTDTEDQFEYLAKKTGGKAYDAISSEELSESIERIIDHEVGEKTIFDIIIDFLLGILDIFVSILSAIFN